MSRPAPPGAPRPRARPSSRHGRVLWVALLGELLLSFGVLLGLYVVWQLWWTDVQALRVQGEILAEFDAVAPDPDNVAADVRRDAPPIMSPPALGEVFATLYVPRWDDAVMPIAAGIDKREILDRALAGHYPETVMPGEVGNFALAGHRQTFGAIFRRVQELKAGDPIVVQAQGVWYVYRVAFMQAVKPHQVEAIAPVPWQPGAEPVERYLTLTTCHPIGLNSLLERFIVNARFDYWLPVEAGTPPDLAGQPPPPAEGAGT